MTEIRQDKRGEALAAMRAGVADGSLCIRQMTADECVRHAAARAETSARPSPRRRVRDGASLPG